jgi:hypothetical protein
MGDLLKINKEKEITICVKCENCIIIQDKGHVYYYDYLCKAFKRQKEIDPITGNEYYFLKNSLGLKTKAIYGFEDCREINKGHCKHFKAILNYG